MFSFPFIKLFFLSALNSKGTFILYALHIAVLWPLYFFQNTVYICNLSVRVLRLYIFCEFKFCSLESLINLKFVAIFAYTFATPIPVPMV
jgi:hypothetical protein